MALSSRFKLPLLKDGGLGTALLPFLQAESCCDLLNLSQPEQVLDVHRAFLTAGARLLTSNTFAMDAASLRDSGTTLSALSQRGAELARQIAGSQAQVAGSLGPGWKSPSRGDISVQTLESEYYQRSLGLLQGGVDLLWIETVQDPRQAEAAVQGALRAQAEVQLQRPLAILVSVSAEGRHIGDWPAEQVLQALLPLPLQYLGINCSHGPASTRWALDWLRSHSPHKRVCCPNAGLPDQSLPPEAYAQALLQLQEAFAPDILGGCCGASPAHIECLQRALTGAQTGRKSASLEKNTDE